MLVQFLYPTDHLPLFARVEGVGLSGWSKADAQKRLDNLSTHQRVAVTLGSNDQAYRQATPASIGLNISHAKELQATGYPFFIRLIPTSLFWFGALQHEPNPTYTNDTAAAKTFIKQAMGEECKIEPKNASLEVKSGKLALIRSEVGGSCQIDQAAKALTSAKPLLNKPTKITIPINVTAPEVGDTDAKALANRLNTVSKDGITLTVAGKTQTIAQSTVLGWLTFKPGDGALDFDISADKAAQYMAKNVTPLVTKPAGVTKVSTTDFTETSRSTGATGQTLDLGATLNDVKSVLRGEKKSASASTTTLAPKVEYSRTYSHTSTGIAALLQFYDDDNAGTFGVSFQELGGRGLSAQHNASAQYVTASTYKLFVAFSTLRRVDAGQMKWDDANIASGRDLSTCFNDMIVKSDNACAEALIKKIGASSLNADIKSIGLGSTAFRSDNNLTTANDLVNYLTQLETGKLPIKPESRDRLISAMKRNVYRQGSPSGASGQTADKVGFLWGLLHDAALVYSPTGTYVLAVMSDGSSWGNIADLTRKIEALRQP
jgi:beta-lactamase class A